MIKAGIIAFVFCSSIISIKAEAYTIMVWGDSLSAAYDIPVEKGWVSLLGERLADRDINVINRSINGEKTASGLARLPGAFLDINPDLLILELGANDGLFGLGLDAMQKNLASMIELAGNDDIEVLLLGIKLPPNYGRAYTDAFHQIYLDLASKYNTAIVPFFLESVALDYDLMQDDGFHPNVAAQPLILENIWPVLSPLLPD